MESNKAFRISLPPRMASWKGMDSLASSGSSCSSNDDDWTGPRTPGRDSVKGSATRKVITSHYSDSAVDLSTLASLGDRRSIPLSIAIPQTPKAGRERPKSFHALPSPLLSPRFSYLAMDFDTTANDEMYPNASTPGSPPSPSLDGERVTHVKTSGGRPRHCSSSSLFDVFEEDTRSNQESDQGTVSTSDSDAQTSPMAADANLNANVGSNVTGRVGTHPIPLGSPFTWTSTNGSPPLGRPGINRRPSNLHKEWV